MKCLVDVCCKMSILKYISIFIVLFAVTMPSFAKNDDYYQTILRVIAYSDIGSSGQICVFNNSILSKNFQNFLKKQGSLYSVVGVNATNFKTTSCQVVYFSNLSDKEENRLINTYPTRKLLSISDNNPQCRLGSSICLSSRVDKVVIAVNFHSLAHSQVKIKSKVLQMLKK